MKIIEAKNLAFKDQPEPMLAADAEKRLKARRAKKALKSTELDIDLFLPTAGSPKVVAETAEIGGQGPVTTRLHVANFQIGRHVFPPGMPVRALAALGDKSKAFAKPLEVAGYLPDHLDFRPTPKALPSELVTPPFMRVGVDPCDRKRGAQATTVFPPENRRVFSDTAYPWCTVGRVDSPLGQASGVMVGPRHLLTVSHTIQWNNNNTAGWVRFRPSFFDGSMPFGDAWGTLIYSKMKVSGPTIDFIEGMFDYVVVVLNRTIGNMTGWMGSRGYTDSWDGNPYWSHIGYPGDLTAGNRPTFENRISLDGAWWQFDSHEAMSHRGDVWPGQSGGPFFGWWSGEAGPRVVAVQSSQNSGENNASGGQDMVDLIIRARNENP